MMGSLRGCFDIAAKTRCGVLARYHLKKHERGYGFFRAFFYVDDVRPRFGTARSELGREFIEKLVPSVLTLTVGTARFFR